MTTNMEELEQYKIRLDMALKTANLCIFEVDLLQQKYTYFANSEPLALKQKQFYRILTLTVRYLLMHIKKPYQIILLIPMIMPQLI